MPISYKYERNLGKNAPEYTEGVSFEKLFNLSSKAEVSGLFKEKIIQWSIINLIIGNSDAHGKNISFFVSKKGLRVAPFYDIVNVTMYQDIYEQDMAMGIDEAFEFDAISEYNLREFLDTNTIKYILYFEEFKKIVSNLSYAINHLLQDDVIISNEIFFNKYIKNVQVRVNRISTLLNAIRYTIPFDGEIYTEFYEYNSKVIKRVLGKDYLELESDEVKVEKYITKVSRNFIPRLNLMSV